MERPAAPIATCPVCRYDLAGLPSEHLCPECGFAYDESTLVWWISSIRQGPAVWSATAVATQKHD